jgi:tricorn protease
LDLSSYHFELLVPKVYDGLNWDPQLRAPLTEPGVNAKAGEYILSPDGSFNLLLKGT